MPTEQDSDDVIYRQEVRIDASPDTVFELLVDAESIRRWIGSVVVADPRPGGELTIDMGGDHLVRGEYVVIERPHRVVFTWGYEGVTDMGPGSSTVHIDLTPDGEGTLLVLIHRDCPPSRRAAHAEGWVRHLAQLQNVAPHVADDRSSTEETP
jgi:uncharacterized protein YndB with AHSA1/START domain